MVKEVKKSSTGKLNNRKSNVKKPLSTKKGLSNKKTTTKKKTQIKKKPASKRLILKRIQIKP